MPRGVKGQEGLMLQIQKIDEKIQKYSGHLSALREQKQELLSRQREADMQELHQYMTEHGLTSRDIIEQLVSDQRIAESSATGESV